jgi:hypothetical protein
MARLINRFDQIPSPLPPPNGGIYVISAHASKFFTELLALMYGGANGGIGGRDMKLMSYNTDGRHLTLASLETIKTSALDYNGERYLSSIIKCVIFRL